jgi:hypothetical protein
MTKHRTRTRIQISDPDALARVIDRIIVERFHGTESDAARTLGVEASLFSRLRGGKASSISEKVLTSIRKSLERPDKNAVDAAVLTAAAAELLNAFDAWVSRERGRLLYHEDAINTPVGRELCRLPAWEHQRASEMEYLIQTLEDRIPGIFDEFDGFLERRRHFRRRAELAYARILGPLLDSVESGHIERRWQDLSDKELKRFVRAGILRERILLERPQDVQQAQEMAKKDPSTLVDLYAATAVWDDRALYGKPILMRSVQRRVREAEVGGNAEARTDTPTVGQVPTSGSSRATT